MKKLVCIISLMLALVCVLVSCGDDEPTVSVNEDGYVVVNGVATEIVADKDDVITVDEDGYVVVNGTKTEHQIHTTDEISVNADGYVVVNGITTDLIIDKEYHTHNFVDGLCSICITPENITEGIIYSISSNRTCAEVVGYEGTATNIKIAETTGIPNTVVNILFTSIFLNFLNFDLEIPPIRILHLFLILICSKFSRSF